MSASGDSFGGGETMDRGSLSKTGQPPRLFESRVLFTSRLVRIGAFRCSPDYPDFATAGTITGPSIVFPRTAVWIRHEGRSAFPADPSLITIYNSGQRYVRGPISPEGDRSDWYEVTPEFLGDVSAFAPAGSGDPLRPFTAAWAPSSTSLYWKQRRLFERLEGPEIPEPLEVEESFTSLLAGVLSAVRSGVNGAPTDSTRSRLRELAHATRAELGLRFAEDLSLHDLAFRLDTSIFMVCRAFRLHMGTTVHTHRTQLRLHAALERLADGEIDLTALALDLGFSSHSHFTKLFRRAYGVTPSRARAQLERPARRDLRALLRDTDGRTRSRR
jgi:AraC-like DNA-binding protein